MTVGIQTERSRYDAGFSTIELMIGLGILAVVVFQTLAILAGQQRTYHGQERVVAAQEDARLAADMMLADVRMAGFMVPAVAGISSRDGGAANADVLCVSDPTALADARVAAATDRFDRAVISAAVTAGATTVSISSGHADVDGDGTTDFVVNRGVILSDGSRNHCATVTSVGSTSIGFTPATTSAISASSGRAVPAVVYELTAAGLERNQQLLSSQVEDVQVEYGLDTSGDGLLDDPGEFPVHDISGADTNLLRAVRLSVLTRTTSEDPTLEGPGRQRVANRNASGAPDAYRRRLAIHTVAPRNML